MKVLVLAQANASFRRSLQQLSKHYDRRYLLALELAVRQKIRWLKDHPGVGQFEPELAWSNAGHRRLIVRDFKIIYRIEEDAIIINDIFDSRQDPGR